MVAFGWFVFYMYCLNRCIFLKFPALYASFKLFLNALVILSLSLNSSFRLTECKREREPQSAPALIMYLDNTASPLTHTQAQQNRQTVKEWQSSMIYLQRELNGDREVVDKG